MEFVDETSKDFADRELRIKNRQLESEKQDLYDQNISFKGSENGEWPFKKDNIALFKEHAYGDPNMSIFYKSTSLFIESLF